METMYSSETCSRIEDMLEDEAIIQKLASADSEEEFKAIFHDAGVDLAESDVASIMEQLDAYKNSDTLSEEQLEAVSGGCILCGIALVGSAIVAGYVVWKVGKWIIDKKYGG